MIQLLREKHYVDDDNVTIETMKRYGKPSDGFGKVLYGSIWPASASRRQTCILTLLLLLAKFVLSCYDTRQDWRSAPACSWQRSCRLFLDATLVSSTSDTKRYRDVKIGFRFACVATLSCSVLILLQSCLNFERRNCWRSGQRPQVIENTWSHLSGLRHSGDF